MRCCDSNLDPDCPIIICGGDGDIEVMNMCIDYIKPTDPTFDCNLWYSQVCKINIENPCNPQTDPDCVCADCGIRRIYLDGVLANVDPSWLTRANIELDSVDWLHLLICKIDRVNAESLI